jgi:hypothetical protein
MLMPVVARMAGQEADGFGGAGDAGGGRIEIDQSAVQRHCSGV